MLMNEEVEKCHQATFVALPITLEMTVGTLHSALTTHADFSEISLQPH
jgi:hypothetical protein